MRIGKVFLCFDPYDIRPNKKTQSKMDEVLSGEIIKY